MTTTLWIVIAALTAVIGAWMGYTFGYVAGHEGGALITKDGILFEGMEKVIKAVDRDKFNCMKSCKDRRTPNEDTNIHLRKIACKFTDEENARKLLNEEMKVGESDIFIKPDFIAPEGYDPSKESIRFVDGELRTVTRGDVEQSNIDAAESAKDGGFPKISTLYGVPLDGSLKELGFTVEEGDEAYAFCFEDRDGYLIWLITHKNHPPVSLADNKIQWLDMTSEPDCEGDDCRLNFRGGGRNG